MKSLTKSAPSKWSLSQIKLILRSVRANLSGNLWSLKWWKRKSKTNPKFAKSAENLSPKIIFLIIGELMKTGTATNFTVRFPKIKWCHSVAELPFLGDLCGLRFKLKCYIYSHMRNVHSSTKKWICNICGKGYAKVRDRKLIDEVLRLILFPERYLGVSYASPLGRWLVTRNIN